VTSCLVIKNDGIGDLILASGLISALGEHFGGDIDLVTCSANREVAEGIEPLRRRFYVSRDDLHFSGRAWSFGWLWPRITPEDAPIIDAIRSRKYDVAICLRRFIRQNSLVIMRATRARRKLCSWQLPTNATRTMAARASAGWERYDGPAHVVSELGYAQGFLRSALGRDFQAEPRLDFCRRQQSSPGGKRIAICIGGSSANWPNGNWIELAMSLSESGWSLVLFGGPEVAELANQICQKMPSAENQVGRLSLEQTATLLGDCAAMIGNDTGITHLASLVVRKCLVILGGGTFRRFFPWPTADNQTIVYHGLDCFDCEWTCKFSERYCLSLVRPRDVLSAFEAMMSASQPVQQEINLNSNVEFYDLAWRHLSPKQQAPFHPLSRTAV